MKVAKLVSFNVTARVIVKKSDMPEVEEEDAINAAIDKIKDNIEDYIHFENVEEVQNDIEVPYDPEIDD